jgi:putative ABC transport system permease protein
MSSFPLCWQLVRLGFRSLMLHKMRSALTVLGMVFGVASVVSILAVGEGASHTVQEELRRLGPDRIMISSMPPADAPNDSKQRLEYGVTEADLHRIEMLVPGLRSVAPSYELTKNVYVDERKSETPLVCTTPPYLDIHRLEVARGRFLASPDVESKANVAVLGADIARELFLAEEPIGQQLKMGSGQYTVVGVLKPRPVVGATVNDPNASIFLPLTTGKMRLEDVIKIESGGGKRYEAVEFHQIGMRVANLDNVEQVAGMLRRGLERYHRGEPDYVMTVPFELLRKTERTKRVFSWVLGSIAGISLLVGGIGIMNIMLATVTERTREIGVRRAVGAKRWHVVLQFLVETIVLSTGGGLLGLLLGMTIPPLITALSDVETIVTAWSLALSMIISVAVGVVFGMYPARRAAAMDPIEALRHE